MNVAKKICIIGGDISGLAAAYYIQEKAKKINLNLDIILIEGSEHLGDKIRSVKENGFLCESSAPALLNFLENLTTSSSLSCLAPFISSSKNLTNLFFLSSSSTILFSLCSNTGTASYLNISGIQEQNENFCRGLGNE